MKALIITGASYNAGSTEVLLVQNALASMGIQSQLQYADATNPTVAMVNRRADIDMVVLPWVASSNYATFARFYDGSVNVPVFWAGNVTSNTNIKGIVNGQDLGAFQKYLVKFSDNDEGFIHYGAMFALNTSLVAPAAATPLIEYTDLISGYRPICCWKYTPDGTNYVYYHKTAVNTYLAWHFMVQQAVNDGVLAAPPKQAPCFLQIDHINADGANNAGGTTENPQLIVTFGDFLRKIGGVCYTSWDRRYCPGGEIGDKTTGQLAANIKAYSDVFKIHAFHDHTTNYNFLTQANTPDDPYTHSRGKPSMDSTYTLNSASMASYGLTPSTDWAHFANDYLPRDWFELGTSDTSYLADPNNASITTGRGFKFARAAGNNPSASFKAPSAGSSSANRPTPHFMLARQMFMGITIIPGGDATNAPLAANELAQTIIDVKFNTTAIIYNMLNRGHFQYFHPLGLEDVAWRTAHVVGAPTTASDGVSTSGHLFECLDMMWNMAKRCPNTIKLGANCLDYVP